MTTHYSIIIVGILLVLLLISPLSASLPWEQPDQLNPPIFLDDPPVTPQDGDQISLPGSGDQADHGSWTPPPDDQIPYPETNPQYPDKRENPAPVSANPTPKERISDPEPENPMPCPNPSNPPFIPPTPEPTPRIIEPGPVNEMHHPVTHPSGNIYPVYEEPPYRHPYIAPSYHDNDWRYCSGSYYSSDWYRTGSLQIISTPDRAEVWLNNKYRGKTPRSGYLDISNLVPGTYDLLVSYSGYLPYTRTIYVGRDEVQTMNVVLSRMEQQTSVPESGISISSEPAGANVLLDNEYRGITPVTLKATTPGEHTITLRKEGYLDFMTRVQTLQDQTLPITAVLNPVPATEAPTRPPTPVQTPVPTTTYAGIPAGLIIISLIAGIMLITRQEKSKNQ